MSLILTNSFCRIDINSACPDIYSMHGTCKPSPSPRLHLFQVTYA